MIVYMVRVFVGVAAWMAGTLIAVCVALLGANVVIRNAGVGPGMPVLNAALLSPSATASPATTPAAVLSPTAGASRTASAPETSPGHTAARGTHSSTAWTSPSPLPSPSPSASAWSSAAASASASAGDVRAYTMTGGNVTLQVTDSAVQLVTAVPDAGWSVQTWPETGWLRVDFTSGSRVSSLIASWYEHAPIITVTNG
jgi:hypothetical protein